MEERKEAIQKYGNQLFILGLILVGLTVISIIFEMYLAAFEWSSIRAFAIPAYLIFVSLYIKTKKLTEVTGLITAVKELSILAILISILTFVLSLSFLTELLKLVPVEIIISMSLLLLTPGVYAIILKCQSQMEKQVKYSDRVV